MFTDFIVIQLCVTYFRRQDTRVARRLTNPASSSFSTHINPYQSAREIGDKQNLNRYGNRVSKSIDSDTDLKVHQPSFAKLRRRR